MADQNITDHQQTVLTGSRFYRKTKIVATLGPATTNEKSIQALIENGVDVFRLNFSHGTHDGHAESVHMIRAMAERVGRPVAILQDLQGPKIRIGKVVDGGITLHTGDTLKITTVEQLGEGDTVSTTYSSLPLDAKKGDRILIDDGLIELTVKSIQNQVVVCEVMNDGVLTSNKGINLPYVNLSTPALTIKDREDLVFAINNDIDFIALSFVRSANDIIILKDILKAHNLDIPIIAKIEKPEATDNIEEIIREAYGLMVARGDLGVELNPEDVPSIQKKIIKLCNREGKPVITATQMLDSMIRNPRPTRAEASDVANAVLDGADAVMLSGETAVGKYPVRSVLMMKKIIQSIESRFMDKSPRFKHINPTDFRTISEAVSFSAVNIANNLNAKMIACVTHTGSTALQIARFKSNLPVMAITDDPEVPKKMSLIWGVKSLLIDKIENTEKCFTEIEQRLENSSYLDDDDLVIFTAGMPTLEKNSTNMIKVHVIKKGESKIL